jgi:hypothetical protein
MAKKSSAAKQTGRKGASSSKSASRGSSSKSNRGKAREKSASAAKGRKKLKKLTMADVRKAVTRTMQRVRAEGPGKARKFIRQAKQTATRVADTTVKVVATTAGVVSEIVHPTESNGKKSSSNGE